MSTLAAQGFLSKRSMALLGWLVLAVFSVSIVWLNQPVHVRGILNEWSTGQAIGILPSSIPDEAFAIYILWLRYAALALCWTAAGLILAHRPDHFPAVVTGLVLGFIPLAFGLAGSITEATYPDPWASILELASFLVSILGMVGFPLVIHLLPDGKLTPAWMKYIILLLVAMVGFFYLASYLQSPFMGDWGWGAIFISIVLAMVSGALSQAIRYFKEPDPARRLSLRPFLFYSVALSVWLVVLFVGLMPGGGLGAMLEVHTQVIFPAGFALVILYAIWHDNLWDIPRPSQPASLWIAVPVLLALIAWWVSIPVLNQSRLARQSEVIVSSVPSEPKIHLIFDTDLAQDDYLALLFLLQHPAVELEAITIAGTGEAHCAPGIKNVLAVLDRVDAPQIPVSCGRETPLAGDHVFPAEWREGVDAFFGIELSPSQRQPATLPAPELIAEVLQNSPEAVTILAVGPLTNLGELFQAHPELSGKIANITIMGGAVTTTGNVWLEDTEYSFAEWNIYIDPVAANLVLQSGAPVTLVPLDATNQVLVERSFKRRLAREAATPAAQLANQLMDTLAPAAGPFYFWDSLAAVLVTDPSLGYYRKAPIRVIEEEGPKSGQTKLDINGVTITYTTGASRGRFEGLLLKVLNLP